MHSPSDKNSEALRNLAALLRERHEFPDMPGPGEGMVSDEETWAEQEEWRKGYDALHRRIMDALTPIEAGDTPVSSTPQNARQWECPVNTVGKLIANLQTLPPEMPFYTAYFVEIEGKRTTRCAPPSLSRETTDGFRVEEYDASNQSLVMWASSAPSAIGAIPEEFAQLASFYDVQDMAALVRIQEERIESMRQQLPKPRGPESDPQNYRKG